MQKDEVTCPRLLSESAAGLGLELGTSSFAALLVSLDYTGL